MKKIVITLAALGALSSAAFASQRGYDLRDSEYFNSTGIPDTPVASGTIDAAPLAIGSDDGLLTNFERLNLNAQENESSGH